MESLLRNTVIPVCGRYSERIIETCHDFIRWYFTTISIHPKWKYPILILSVSRWNIVMLSTGYSIRNSIARTVPPSGKFRLSARKDSIPRKDLLATEGMAPCPHPRRVWTWVGSRPPSVRDARQRDCLAPLRARFCQIFPNGNDWDIIRLTTFIS